MRRARRITLGSTAILVLAITVSRSAQAAPPADAAAPIPDAGTRASADAGSWLESLRKQAVGQPVFLVQGANGMIFGRSLDGAIRKDLVKSDARYPLLDGGLDLLWLHEGTKVDVVDLRATMPKRIPVVRNTRADVAFKVMRGLDEGKTTSLQRDGGCFPDLMTLSWKTMDVAVYMSDGEVDPDVEPRLVGKAWMKTNAHRTGTVEPESVGLWRDGTPSSVALPPALAKCYQAPASQNSSCNRATSFGSQGWGWQLVVTTGTPPTEVDRCVQYGCLLFDPKAKTFASPEDPTKWGAPGTVGNGSCRAFYLDESGRSYLTRTKLCDPEKGCRDLGGTSIGWLPFGARIQLGF